MVSRPLAARSTSIVTYRASDRIQEHIFRASANISSYKLPKDIENLTKTSRHYMYEDTETCVNAIPFSDPRF
jgi:hypothetical protein